MPLARRLPLTALLLLGIALLGGGWLLLGQTEATAGASYSEAVLGRPVRISPLAVQTVEAEADLQALIFAGLMRLRPDGLPEPELAERWEVTADGLTYTFHLRSGVSWHDGAALDAHDVAFTVGRIQSPNFAGPPDLVAAWEGVQVFVADAQTVLMRLPEPSANFLARATLGIVPAHLAHRMDAGAGFSIPPFEREPVGAGPYRLTSLAEDRAVLQRNTSYALGTPAIQRIELRFAADVAAQETMLRAGAVDAALLVEEASAETLEAVRARGLATHSLTRNALTVLYLNNADPVLAQASLRRAIAASIDRPSLLAAAASTGLLGAGVIAPGSWAFTLDSTSVPTTEVLWAEAGWPRGADGRRQRDGVPLILELVTNGESARVALAEAVASQLATHGVTVEVVPVPVQRVVSDYLRPGAYQMAIFGWESTIDPDPYSGWHTSQIGAGNVAAFSDGEADALMETARTTLDIEERRELLALFLARFEERGASLVLDYPQRVYVQPPGLTGFTPRLLTSPASRFEDVHLWRVR